MFQTRALSHINITDNYNYEKLVLVYLYTDIITMVVTL